MVNLIKYIIIFFLDKYNVQDRYNKYIYRKFMFFYYI